MLLFDVEFSSLSLTCKGSFIQEFRGMVEMYIDFFSSFVSQQNRSFQWQSVIGIRSFDPCIQIQIYWSGSNDLVLIQNLAVILFNLVYGHVSLGNVCVHCRWFFFERHENQKSQGENVRMKTKLSFRQCSCSVYINRVCPCTGQL